MIHKPIAITMGLALVLGALTYGATSAFANPCSSNGGSAGSATGPGTVGSGLGAGNLGSGVDTQTGKWR